MGAAVFALVFTWFDYRLSMEIMGCCTIGAAMLTPLVAIQGYQGLRLTGKDQDETLATTKPSRTLLVLARSPHFNKLRHAAREA